MYILYNERYLLYFIFENTFEVEKLPDRDKIGIYCLVCNSTEMGLLGCNFTEILDFVPEEHKLCFPNKMLFIILHK